MQLVTVFTAPAEPVRHDVLMALRKGQRGAGDPAAPFDIPPPAISRHLEMLTQSGLVEGPDAFPARLRGSGPDGNRCFRSPAAGRVATR